MSVLTASNLAKSYGPQDIFEGVSLEKLRTAYPNGEKDEAGRPDPVRGMKVLLIALEVPLRDNPYRQLAAFVTGRLSAG